MSRLVLLAVALIMYQTMPTEDYICWNEQVIVVGRPTSVTRCRVAGEIVDYASEGQVPSVLSPDVGTASNGTCWFWRSAWAGWVIVTRFPDNTAFMGFDPDGIPGGPLALDAIYPICVSEPTDEDPVELLAWELIRDYVHQVPEPILNPEVPWGLTGLETFLAVTPPAPFAASIAAPTGALLEVEAWVAATTIDWGDETVPDSFPPEAFPDLNGYPDGLALHVYEVKTCDPPGARRRCHPTLSAYPVLVSYQWFAHWRVDGGDWQAILVPDTLALTDYPVQEVIAVLDGR